MSGQDALPRVALLAELGVMSQTLVHELRQPLFAAIAGLEMEMAIGTPSRRLSLVLEQLRHLQEVADRYYGFGQDEGPPIPLPLAVPVEAAVLMLRHRASSASVELRYATCIDSPWAVVRGSAVRQIALNLLTNAVDAVEGMPVREVDVRVGFDGAWALLEVRDTGSGLSLEAGPRVFERHFTTKPPGRGSGLGLYVSRMLAEEAGGSLELGAGEDGGCVARLTLPLHNRGTRAP